MILLLLACGGAEGDTPSATPPPSDPADSGVPVDSAASADTGGSGDTADTASTPAWDGPWPFADSVVSWTPGEGAGYGQDRFPDVVLGPPRPPEGGGGSLDVLSLGRAGEIVLGFRDRVLVDGPGPDLLVFENPFAGWVETAFVAVSDDGVTWSEWPCDPADAAGGYPGCAGVAPVLASPGSGIDPTDPAVAGGDAFDLAALGVSRARWVRIRDSGANTYAGTGGGFDLDAVAIVNGAAP